MGIGGGGNATHARRRVDDTPSTRALVHAGGRIARLAHLTCCCLDNR